MNVTALFECSLTQLSNLITESTKVKRCCAVVLDPSLVQFFQLNPKEPSIFARHGATREFLISKEELDWRDDGPVVFVLRPNPETCRKAAVQMRRLLTIRAKPDFKSIFIPRRSFRCEEVFKEEDVLSFFNQGIYGVHFGFSNLEDDLLSLELDDFLKKTKIEGDTASYSFAARALLDLGSIENIYFRGYSSKEVFDLYNVMLKELKDLNRDESEDDDGVSSTISNSSATPIANDDDEDEEDLNLLGGEEDAKKLSSHGGPLDILGAFPRKFRLKKKKMPQIDTMIILDREVDMISPLLTGFTYETLLDETFHGLKSGFLKVEESKLKIYDGDEDHGDDGNLVSSSSTNEIVTVSLHDDRLFHTIRKEHIINLMKVLNERARALNSEREEVLRSREVEALQRVVDTKIYELRAEKSSLVTHIALAKSIQNLVFDRRFRLICNAERSLWKDEDGTFLFDVATDLVARGEDLFQVLKLFCLYCIVSGGFSTQKLNDIRTDLIHAYGFDIMFTLDNLEKLGILAQRPFHPQHKLSVDSTTSANQTRSIFTNWRLVKETFNLHISSCESGEQTDMAYVFSGLSPLSVKLVQMVMYGGWDPKKNDILGVDIPSYPQKKTASKSAHTNNSEKPILLVFYLGGVCYSEIAALRFLSSKHDCPYKVCIAATSICNGTSLIRNCSSDSVGI